MTVSARALNRTTLTRQLLLERTSLPVSEAVRRVVALQAQHPASPYLALWNRLHGFDASELDRAFDEYTIVKSNVPRMTLHAIHADDFRAFREALEPSLRGAKLHDRRFRVSGLTLDDADALIAPLYDFASEPRTAAACEAWLEDRVGAEARRPAWWGLRQYAPLLRAPGDEPWRFDQRISYVAPPVRPTLADAATSARSLATLIRRYLAGFGPATVADIGLFCMVYRGKAKEAIDAHGGDLERLEGPNGQVLYDVPGAPYADEDVPAPPRLLGMWDNVLLAHDDRDRVIPPEYRAHVTRKNGDVLPTLFVDGYVAGVWRAVDDGIEATAFHRLADEVWAVLDAEAAALLKLIADREPGVYGRYGHWWEKLDGAAAETRVLGG
jgi:hypothetical protein